ncbi:uncharacterized protein LOC122659465 [Telopea speciosissima]|uniref:uncharacterized protein LOC122659465 n=1 Tax=Telopea speciosissima TaxID=54955 RepID=UPI001CC757B6|nr:uncharacterized protein LOC122659465 [Telopea speciosissima]
MVAVFNKELLSWYLITLKLRETVKAGIANSPGSIPSRDLQLGPLHWRQSHTQPPPEQQRLTLQESSFSQSHLTLINGDDKNVKEEREVTNPMESDWAISIREKLEQAHQDHEAASWAKLCIYRVPQYLRVGDDYGKADKAFVPQIISLGPYHHGRKNLRDMDRHKWRSLYQVLNRTHQDVNLYLDSIWEVEEKAQAYYEGPISLSSNKSMEMMVLNG